MQKYNHFLYLNFYFKYPFYQVDRKKWQSVRGSPSLDRIHVLGIGQGSIWSPMSPVHSDIQGDKTPLVLHGPPCAVCGITVHPCAAAVYGVGSPGFCPAHYPHWGTGFLFLHTVLVNFPLGGNMKYIKSWKEKAKRRAGLFPWGFPL